MKYILIFAAFLSFAYSGCSSSKEETKQESQSKEIWVFDEVPDNTSNEDINTEKIVKNEKVTSYYVQIGAFTTEDKANEFVTKAYEVLKEKINVTYNSFLSLYVVRLEPFDSREKAELKRNSLWKMKNFSDAFIVTITK